jgi:hypothetical protein
VPIDLWRIGRAPDRPSPLRAKARCGSLVASPETLELRCPEPFAVTRDWFYSLEVVFPCRVL